MTDMSRLFVDVPLDERSDYELELAALCPVEFYYPGNPWTHHAARLLSGQADTSGWNWCADDDKVALWKKHVCFNNMCRSANPAIDRTAQAAVLAWMLSHMLREAPEPQSLTHSA